MSHMKTMAIDAMNKEDPMSIPEKKPRLVNGKTTITADLAMIRARKRKERAFRWWPDCFYVIAAGMNNILYIFVSLAIGILTGINHGFEKTLEATLIAYRKYFLNPKGGKYAKKSVHRRTRTATRKN